MKLKIDGIQSSSSHMNKIWKSPLKSSILFGELLIMFCLITVTCYIEVDFNNSFIDRWCKINSQSSLKDLGLVASTCWVIWGDKNKFVHGEEISPINLKCQRISKYLASYRSANQKTIPMLDPPSVRGLKAQFGCSLQAFFLSFDICLLLRFSWTSNWEHYQLNYLRFSKA